MRSFTSALTLLAIVRGAVSFQCAVNLSPLCCTQVGSQQSLGGLLGSIVCGLNDPPTTLIAGGCTKIAQGADCAGTLIATCCANTYFGGLLGLCALGGDCTPPMGLPGLPSTGSSSPTAVSLTTTVTVTVGGSTTVSVPTTSIPGASFTTVTVTVPSTITVPTTVSLPSTPAVPPTVTLTATLSFPAVGAAEPTSAYKLVNPCAVDNAQRIFAGDTFIDTPRNTPEGCVAGCAAAGYNLSGVEFGMECHCGTGFAQAVQSAPPSECNTPCSGDSSITCGGPFRIQIFDLGGVLPPVTNSLTSTITVPTTIGSTVTVTLPPTTVPSGTTVTVTIPPVSATGPTVTVTLPPTTVSESMTVTVTLPGTGTAPAPTALPAGYQLVYPCVVDDVNGVRILANDNNMPSSTNTPFSCVAKCSQLGYAYAGVEYGTECHCGTGLALQPQNVDPSQCNMPCSGDPNFTCGGSWRMELYAKP